MASASMTVEEGAPRLASSLLGENAAKAAIARRAITTQVAKARSLVNLTPDIRLVNEDPRCASMGGIVWRLGTNPAPNQSAKTKPTARRPPPTVKNYAVGGRRWAVALRIRPRGTSHYPRGS